MSYIGQQLPADVFSGFVTDSFTGDGSATTFTLSKAPFSEDTLIVVINNVIQKPTTNFTVSGTTLTIVGTAVASGDVIYAIHTGGPLPIGGAAELDLNGASDKLILDLDGDTTISADTDDQIDFKAGGTDIMSLTATTAQINDGLTVTVADNTDTLTLVSTDADASGGPVLDFYRNSSSPADSDSIAKMTFRGRNDNSEDVDYGKIDMTITDASDGSEDSEFNLSTIRGGTIRSQFKANNTETVFNDDSVTIDFRVESSGATHALYVDAAENRVGIGTSSPDYTLHVRSMGSPSNDTVIDIEGNATDSNCIIQFTDSGGNLQGRISYDTDDDNLQFNVNGSERARFNSTGTFMIATTDQYAYDNTSDQAITFNNTGLGSFARQQAASIVGNRMTDDGNVINVYGQGSLEGGITVSGSTVAISGFTGVHWSRLADNSKPTILRGTIIESIDEMCDWYAVDFEVERTDKDIEGNLVTKKYSKRQAYGLKDGESVGDTITYRYLDGNDYSAKIIKEGDVKHTKCKISDTADSKKIYGVFYRWDDADDGSDGDVNDMEVAQVGTYIIRVNKDVTVEAGDLLVSNGDGTAKLQDDDIIRSKTVAKVNSNIKVETYSDGSYTVPCTLHC